MVLHGSQQPDFGNTLPVGYQVEDTRVSLLHESGRPVEPGEVGEIAVTSRYLATGYWRRPDLTEAAFTPAHDGHGERTYRTGDFGRLSSTGCLEHPGSTDFFGTGRTTPMARTLDNYNDATTGLRDSTSTGDKLQRMSS